MRAPHEADMGRVDIGEALQIGQCRQSIAAARERTCRLRPIVRANTLRRAARSEAVRDDYDIAVRDELSCPAQRRAARARTQAAAVMQKNDGGKGAVSRWPQQPERDLQ